MSFIVFVTGMEGTQIVEKYWERYVMNITSPDLCKLYALDTKLDLDEGIEKGDIVQSSIFAI